MRTCCTSHGSRRQVSGGGEELAGLTLLTLLTHFSGYLRKKYFLATTLILGSEGSEVLQISVFLRVSILSTLPFHPPSDALRARYRRPWSRRGPSENPAHRGARRTCAAVLDAPRSHRTSACSTRKDPSRTPNGRCPVRSTRQGSRPERPSRPGTLRWPCAPRRSPGALRVSTVGNHARPTPGSPPARGGALWVASYPAPPAGWSRSRARGESGARWLRRSLGSLAYGWLTTRACVSVRSRTTPPS